MTDQRTASEVLAQLADAIDKSRTALNICRLAVVGAFQNAETPSEESEPVEVCEALIAESAALDAAYEAAAAGLDALGGSVVVAHEVSITSACLRLEGRVAKLMVGSKWLAERVELWREVATDLGAKRT